MTTDEYNEIVDKYSDNIYNFIIGSTKHKEQAEDIIQEAYERLWKNKNNVEFQKAKSYLFSTAYHIMIDDFRKNKRVSFSQNPDFDLQYAEKHNFDLQEILHKAIATLPDIQQKLILLRDYEGYSYKEISKITNLNESQVKVYIFRARKSLKEIIGKIENII